MKEEIRNYLLANSATGGVHELADDDSLLETGVLDSMSMVEMIAFLEGNYDISVGEDDMVPENFDSISAIASYTEGKRLSRI